MKKQKNVISKSSFNIGHATPANHHVHFSFSGGANE